MSLDFPTFYLLRIGFENKTAALQDLEREIGKSLTYNNGETNIFVGKVSKARRAVMELKAIKVHTEPVVREVKKAEELVAPAKKRRKVETAREEKEPEYVWIDSDTTSEDDIDGGSVVVKKPRSNIKSSPAQGSSSPVTLKRTSTALGMTDEEDAVKVVKLDWYFDSVKERKVLPVDAYLVYEGRRIPKPSTSAPKPASTILPAAILARARADSPPPPSFAQRQSRGPSGRHNQSQSQRSQKVRLIHQTTSEHEDAHNLPPLPDYCATQYCCQRPTPSQTPNDPFIALLKKIQRVRVLQCDENGVRAYNKAIASIAAYPYTITHVDEILRLPGCGSKYAGLYQEWKDTGHIREVDDFESSEKMQILNLFYGIHDVAGKTSNLFYDKGWRDLADVTEHGWKTLNREQQVGLKYYDDFQTKIPRLEVEEIGRTVLEFASDLRPGFQMVICGGYRRGKKMCGDVDIILTHPDEEATARFITPLMENLVRAGYIPHTLQKSDRNSDRGQEPLNWKGGMPRSAPGFDSLDKALVVWQDPEWPTMESDLSQNPEAKNPNLNRRVDIIISPWKTAGCAIVGWSGATMFERDIRRYCRYELGYKFDSSGVRRLDDGEWVDLEGDATDLVVKEKRVFEGLGLEWREPTLRCTDG
jgi:DNA polymerase IV